MKEEVLEEIDDHECFDTAESKVNYSRSRDTKRVTCIIQDPKGISELKLLLILYMEVDKIERRLGIHQGNEDEKH